MGPVASKKCLPDFIKCSRYQAGKIIDPKRGPEDKLTMQKQTKGG